LTAVLMQLEAAQRSFERDPARTRARITRAHELARDALDHVRRSVWTLAEPLVSSQMLSDSLREVAESFTARTSVLVELQHSGEPPELSAAAATQVVRIVQEALTNCEKHAQATRVWVESCTTADQYQVAVRDNGVGFRADQPAPLDRSGFGLTSIHERARLAGGALQIESAPGAGTSVQLVIPTDAETIPEVHQ
jgi:signal transduction histidine kinase